MVLTVYFATTLCALLLSLLMLHKKIDCVGASFCHFQQQGTLTTTFMKKQLQIRDDDCIRSSIEGSTDTDEGKFSSSNSKNRRHFFSDNMPKLLFGPAIAYQFGMKLKPVFAAYGDSTKIELPSYIDFLIEKNQQIDSSKVLYQGADRSRQFERIVVAVSKLKTIPDTIKSKKWSQIQGTITGPLGTLIVTMNEIVASIPNDEGQKKKDAQQLLTKVKGDLYSIGQGATAKNEKACIVATQATFNDLNEFVRIVF